MLCTKHKTFSSSPTGMFKDIYNDYKYTYYGCGIILIVSSVMLFVGMGINYRLLEKEKQEEERKVRMEGRDDDFSAENMAKYSMAGNDLSVPLKAAEDSKTNEDAV